MPVDNRRLQAPDNSESYKQYIKKDVENYETRLKQILGANKIRKDGRGCEDHRKIYTYIGIWMKGIFLKRPHSVNGVFACTFRISNNMKTGVVTQAKGSAYLELNKTKVLVSVFDPREIPRLSEFTPNGELYCEFKFAPFSCSERRGHIMDLEEKDLSVILRRSLEPVVCRHEFPNFQVDIYALLLDNDGSCLSAAITAAGLALADAGIPMYDIVTSVSLGIHNDEILVDPSLEEEKFCKTFYQGHTKEMGTVSLSYMPTLGQVTELTLNGIVKTDKILQTMDLLISKCRELSKLTEKCLVENINQHFS